MRALIIGGGAIGLLQARSLANEGYQVELIERGELGREASWAGGGIISPLYPWRYMTPVTALAARSQSLYSRLVSELHVESGIDPEYSDSGLLILNVEDRVAALKWSEHYAQKPADIEPKEISDLSKPNSSRVSDPWIEQIDRASLYSLEPHLSSGFNDALWMPKVASIRNPRFLHALRKIVRSHDLIKVREQTEVKTIQDGTVQLQNGEWLDADIVVICSGAWTSKLVPGQDWRIEPVKGQMIVFDAPKGLINRVVLSDGRYLIPRKDGKLVAGSTLEYTGFDKQTTDEAFQSLRQSAIELCPELSNVEVIHQWAGLRPGSPNGIPRIGKVDGYQYVYVNAGHFRNGLVLAPASVELLMDQIAKRPTKIDFPTVESTESPVV